jgi:hypothetical protein
MTFLQLFSPCLFGHGDMLRTRDDQGHLALQCMDCGHTTRVLEQPPIRGPKHGAVPVKGAPLVSAKRAGVPKRAYPRLA